MMATEVEASNATFDFSPLDPPVETAAKGGIMGMVETLRKDGIGLATMKSEVTLKQGAALAPTLPIKEEMKSTLETLPTQEDIGAPTYVPPHHCMVHWLT
jgi:hypothetical protein